MKNYFTLTLISIIFVSILLLNNCKTEEKSIASNDLLIGQKLLINNCAACHNLPDKSRTGIAPPFSHIKDVYFTENETKFKQAMVQFLDNPTVESAKLKNAVENHGLMPKMSYSEEDVALIAAYLHQADLNHFTRLSGGIVRKNDSVNYLKIGKGYALKTKSVLGKNLIKNIKLKGAAGAVEFCNEKAIFYTDSVSETNKVKIKRVSDKPRNTNNMANSSELEYINKIKKQLAKGEKISGITIENANSILGYYPIETNDMCMKCHGDIETQINKKTALKISELYPEDKATGYSSNQVRGIWVVEIPKK